MEFWEKSTEKYLFSRSRNLECFNHFREIPEYVQNDAHTLGPHFMCILETIEKNREFMTSYCQLIVWVFFN